MVSREKQLKRLKKDAQRLWSDQQELLNRANDVARAAWPHATAYAKGRVGPTAATLYEDRVKPVVERGAVVGAAAGKVAASTAKDTVFGTVVPALSSIAGAALTLADEASNRLGFTGDTAKRAAQAVGVVTKKGHKADRRAAAKTAAAIVAAKAAAKAAKRKSSGGIGIGGTIGILLGVAAIAGIAYAVWQTLRADDDLWVADDEPDAGTPSTPAP
ncbi:MAG TPA: hypothetical protein VGO26_00375 [Amnibacterium sp.]|jgi:ElaB/YqjD/DUF883 family membrane-anchored ribosome-binding protein|nr:hypothetical protein [Amnibacterium sp.]